MGHRLLLPVIALLVVLGGCVGAAGPVAQGWHVTASTEDAGLDYTTTATGLGNGNPGVYVADYDHDGWTDVLAIGGDRPALFRNAEGTFERSDALPPLESAFQGALFFDADGDGWEDLLLLPRHGEAVFLRNEEGTFTRETVGLAVPLTVPVGASTADYDGDGDLDVFVIQYGDWAAGTPAGYFNATGYIGEDNGNPNLLFENTDAGFERVENAGIAGSHWSLATSFVDLTGDGRPDVHVANDFNNDTLYVNRGDGSFERIVMGAETARNGMSSEIADFDGDGRMDVFVTNIYFPLSEENVSAEKYARLKNYFDFVLRSKRIEGNNLLLNRGNGTFAPAAQEYGVRKGGWGWAAVATDLDNDGRRDLFHATQTIVRIDEEDPRYTYPMVWLRGEDRFERRDAAGLGFAELNGRGAAELDYDRDGDMDLLVAPYDGAVAVYENGAESLAGANSLQLRIVDGAGATAIGARASVTVDGATTHDVLNAKADYQSQDARLVHVGLGDAERVDEVRVAWPDGTTLTLEDVPANGRLVVSPDGIESRTDYGG